MPVELLSVCLSLSPCLCLSLSLSLSLSVLPSPPLIPSLTPVALISWAQTGGAIHLADKYEHSSHHVFFYELKHGLQFYNITIVKIVVD